MQTTFHFRSGMTLVTPLNQQRPDLLFKKNICFKGWFLSHGDAGDSDKQKRDVQQCWLESHGVSIQSRQRRVIVPDFSIKVSGVSGRSSLVLHDHLRRHMPGHVGQAIIPAAVAIGQAFMIEAHHRGVQIVDWFLDRNRQSKTNSQAQSRGRSLNPFLTQWVELIVIQGIVSQQRAIPFFHVESLFHP